ncbi:MAG TPA: TolC family protein [Gemmatimonadaceae bacterium]|nr:TolC family protein [Gemmatimonadaceae bacterium]
MMRRAVVALLVCGASAGAQEAASAAQSRDALTLSRAVERALASHPSIAGARAGHDRALAELGDARAAERPRVTADASLTQFQEPMVVLPLHGFDPGNPPLFDRSLVQSGVSFGWTLYDFGQRSARVRAQGALGDAAFAAVSTAERQIIARTSNAYVRVLSARGVLAAHDQRIAALRAAAGRMRSLLAEGKAARVEQLRVDAETQRAIADRIGTEAQLALAQQELAQLMGVSVRELGEFPPLGIVLPRTVAGDFATDTTDASRRALVAQAVKSSSELRELDDRSRAASALVAASHATRYPELRALGAVVDRGRLKGDFAAEWQLGVALSYPLYTGGSRTHVIARAEADERALRQQTLVARLNVESGIDRALAALREAHARTAALESAVEQSTEVSRIERLSIDVGSGTQSDFLAAEAALLQVRAGLIEARNAEFSARVELARLTGELTREWIARAAGTTNSP